MNCRYLPELPIPAEQKLIAIKSPKGTGKTQLLERIGKNAQNETNSVTFSKEIASRTEGTSSHRVRVYRVVHPEDGRFEVFKQWLACDQQPGITCDRWQDFDLSYVDSIARSMGSSATEHVQLCLSFLNNSRTQNVKLRL